MNHDLLSGRLVHLKVEEPQTLAEACGRWNQNSEYLRLLDAKAANPASIKKISEWILKDQEKNPPQFLMFGIRTLQNEQLVGFIELDGDFFPNGEAFVGIGVGDCEFWGQGYGTDAMMVILRFAFKELNLRRVSLDTFEFNPRAVRSYEKAGFIHEGAARDYLHRDGQRWDLIFMGILREEWLAMNKE
jgi:RimJ/RimL family protein N-acetyltransferase